MDATCYETAVSAGRLVQAMMLAYCRKKKLEGIMDNKDNWRTRVQQELVSTSSHAA